MSRFSGESIDFQRKAIQRRLLLALTVGSFFLLSGLAKAIASPVEGIPPGIEGFSAYLSAAGVPLPQVSAVVVCGIEVLCGAGLAAGALWHRVRPARQWLAGVLALEMAAAMAFVGIPTALGDPVILDGQPVTDEIYRLPLELGLFLALAALVWWSPRAPSPSGR